MLIFIILIQKEVPSTVSLADELIAERRAEVEGEAKRDRERLTCN